MSAVAQLNVPDTILLLIFFLSGRQRFWLANWDLRFAGAGMPTEKKNRTEGMVSRLDWEKRNLLEKRNRKKREHAEQPGVAGAAIIGERDRDYRRL